MTALQVLLREQQQGGLSFEAMAIRSRREGHDITKQYFQQVAAGKIKRPSAERLAAIADGLPGITETQVREAAARSAGVHVEHNITYEMSQLLGFVEDLSLAQRSRWLRLAAALARELAAEESVPGRTVLGHVGPAPTEHTRRASDRTLDDIESNLPPTQRRSHPPG